MQDSIRNQALALGFDAVGFTSPELRAGQRAGLEAFLAAGHHGDMGWMEERAHLRGDPKALWPEAKSVIVVAHNYAPTENPLEKLKHKSSGAISAYAGNRDYHDVMKKRLKQLARWLVETQGGDVKIFVDTAPVMEKALAAQAGIGWQGKHTCVVSREFGNWLFLGSVFTTLELYSSPRRGEAGRGAFSAMAEQARPHPNPPPMGEGVIDHCGSCTKCLDICPTQAFTAARKLDARKCIAYLTIEHKGQIPLEYRRAIGNRVYGCDDCLAVCPWNKFAKDSREAAYYAREELKSPSLAMLAGLDDAAFRALFSGSPVKRTGRDRFVRNVLVAIGNSGDLSLLPVAEGLRGDASDLVAEMAGWACGELENRHPLL